MYPGQQPRWGSASTSRIHTPPAPSPVPAYPLHRPSPPPPHFATTANPHQWQSGQTIYFGGSGAPPSVSQRAHNQPLRQLSSYGAPNTPVSPSSGRPSPPIILSEASCCCCGTQLRYQRGVTSFQCTICSTICDVNVPGSSRSASPGLDFVVSADQIRSIPPAPDPTLPDPLPAIVSQMFRKLRFVEASFRETNQQRPSFEIVKEFYDKVLQHPKAMSCLQEEFVQLLRRPGSTLAESDGTWVIVLMECPLLLPLYTKDHALRSELVARIIGLIANLPNALHHHLVQYLSSPTYPHQDFQDKVEMVTSFISNRIANTLHTQGGYTADWGVKVGSRFDALLFASNSIRRRLPLAAFSCTFIDSLGPAALVESLNVWESRTDLFSLCQYPFLLSLGVKIHLLAHDGARQMEDRAREAARTRMYHNPLELPFFVLRVRRNRLVEDSLRQISSNPFELRKSLKIVFEGEDGVDAGGLRKEWFLLLCRQLFDPQFGMFTTDEDSNLCWFNPASLESLDEFFLVGSVLGLAIYNTTTLDVPLPLAAYKKLKHESVTLEDLAVFRPGLAAGLQAMLNFEGNVEEVFCRTFVGDVEEWGTVREVPLMPDGENIPVTNENREDFVKRYVDFILNTSVEAQFNAFSQGFGQVTSGNCFSLFKGEEVELVVRGSREPLDIDLLKSVTVYDGFFRDAESDPTIQIFWEVVSSFSDLQQRQLLSFITGSDRIPATGSSALQLKITCMGGDIGRWPQSHTCFNQLCLYRYTTREVMEERLLRAMGDSEGFGLR